LLANSLKQIRHNPNLRKNPCFLPHFQHRFTFRVENFGFFFDLATTDVFAIYFTDSNLMLNFRQRRISLWLKCESTKNYKLLFE
jgi:hypothetical protein